MTSITTLLLRLAAAGCLPVLLSCAPPDPDAPVPLEDPGVFQPSSAPYRTELMEIVLQPGEGREITAALDEDQVMIFNWSGGGGRVYSDFHGHVPDDDSFWVRYRELDGAINGAGSLTAPFSGHHGWFYRNDTQGELVITLRVSGFFNEIVDSGIITSAGDD